MLLRSGLIIVVSSCLAGQAPVIAQESEPTVEALWDIVQRQQAEIEELRAMLGSVNAQVDATGRQLEATEQKVAATGDFVESLAIPVEQGTRIGAYGELHYNNHDSDDGARAAEVDMHRFVMFLDHRFSDRTRFFSELEVEHSLAGDGEPGAVELEQAYVEFSLRESLTARAGLFLLPVGILNETHEPPAFYGVERNDVENVIIPSTWWEAGAGLSGNFANGLSWDFAVHSGLAMETTGADAFRVRSGRQEGAEALANDGAYTFRLKYTGRPGLELGASLQYQSDASQEAGDGLDSGRLFSAHAIYDIGDFGIRALYGSWDFDGAAVEAAGADRQTGWYIEPSYRFGTEWGLYARYADVRGARERDTFTQWEAGFNYWPLPSVVLKLDYRQREHGPAAERGRDFSGFDLGLGYQF